MQELNIPKHIGIIMDGNGRWAQARNMNRTSGHKEGAKAVRKAITHARETGIKVLTLYAFSTENWSRPAQEVNAIMDMVGRYLSAETETMVKNGIKMKLIGDKSRFSGSLLRTINESEEKTKDCKDMILNIALNYGGRHELIRAMQSIASLVKDGDILPGDINEELVEKHLDTYGSGDCDLIIRTGGEKRISNFLMWQGAYSELYFSDVLWPDFDNEEFDKAINFYSSRQRRFGGLK
ncbi:MAG: isoprenyl transferase [Anaerofustis stercorihominis]|nr:isoprenyl transferase [Anaerofustis stercorihominis]